MRYSKGSLQPSPENLFLLQQILHCGVVSRPQLYQFRCLSSESKPINKKVYGNRLRLLEQHHLVRRFTGAPGRSEDLFVITLHGVNFLLENGEYYSGRGVHLAILGQEKEEWRHWIKLNEIWLAFLRLPFPMFLGWEPESVIRSRADSKDQAYAKEYDAVVTLLVEDQILRMAIEYEQTQKSEARYREIGKDLEKETLVDAILYVVPGNHLKVLLSSVFQEARQSIYIGFLQELEKEPLTATITGTRYATDSKFSDVLEVLAQVKREWAESQVA